MNKMPKPDDHETARKPSSITAAEFDAKFDAGEDISEYIDWESGVWVTPDESSPDQKSSIWGSAETNGSPESEPATMEEQPSLNVHLPSWAFDQLQRMAAQRGISQEELAQLMIVRQFQFDRGKIQL